MGTSMEGSEEQLPVFRDIRRYYCEHCGICRSKKSLLRTHILLHHKEEMHQKKLDEVCATNSTGQKVQHTCEECGASFWKPAYLLQHMRSHSVQRLFACPVEDCGFSYRRRDHLNRHLLKHKGKIFDCPIEGCSRTFSLQCNMKRHVNELHDDDSCVSVDDSPCEREKQYACEKPGCGKVFKHPSRLKKHENSHVTLEFLELYCGEPGCLNPFTNADCLKAHIQACHRYMKCEVCGTQQLKKNFKRHQRSHEGFAREKIKCTFEGCEHAFSSKSNLNKHVKAVHEELRLFSCRTAGCQQKFTYKHVRDKHELTHQYVQGDFFEADERWRARPRGGRKRQRITVETLTRKRVAPLDRCFISEDGADYLRFLLSDGEEQDEMAQ